MKTILKEKCQNCSEEGTFFEGQDEFRYVNYGIFEKNNSTRSLQKYFQFS